MQALRFGPAFSPLIFKIKIQIMRKIVVMMISVMILIIACSKGNDMTTTTDCSGEAKSYATDVSPVINHFVQLIRDVMLLAALTDLAH